MAAQPEGTFQSRLSSDSKTAFPMRNRLLIRRELGLVLMAWVQLLFSAAVEDSSQYHWLFAAQAKHCSSILRRESTALTQRWFGSRQDHTPYFAALRAFHRAILRFVCHRVTPIRGRTEPPPRSNARNPAASERVQLNIRETLFARGDSDAFPCPTSPAPCRSRCRGPDHAPLGYRSRAFPPVSTPLSRSRPA